MKGGDTPGSEMRDSKMNINRRRVLQGIGVGAGALSVSGVLAAKAGNPGFTHGVASGDPLSDRVILWSRYKPASNESRVDNIIWQVAYDRSFGDLAASGITSTAAARDYTVKVDATGLQPGRHYFYRFEVNGQRSEVGRTKTLPRGSVDRFRIGVASCSNYPQGYFHAYDDMEKADLDLILHLGDYLYEYAQGRYVNPIAEETLGRVVQPAAEILSLDDYRRRYALYRSDKDLRAAHAAHPWICVWDDHELTNNTWKSGARITTKARVFLQNAWPSRARFITSGCRFVPLHKPIKHPSIARFRLVIWPISSCWIPVCTGVTSNLSTSAI